MFVSYDGLYKQKNLFQICIQRPALKSLRRDVRKSSDVLKQVLEHHPRSCGQWSKSWPQIYCSIHYRRPDNACPTDNHSFEINSMWFLITIVCFLSTHQDICNMKLNSTCLFVYAMQESKVSLFGVLKFVKCIVVHSHLKLLLSRDHGNVGIRNILDSSDASICCNCAGRVAARSDW